MRTQATPYEQDFYTWTQEQAALLRKGACRASTYQLAEEIESLGISQKHALASHLKNLVMHLLKWHYQPSGRRTGHSWQSRSSTPVMTLPPSWKTSPVSSHPSQTSWPAAIPRPGAWRRDGNGAPARHLPRGVSLGRRPHAR